MTELNEETVVLNGVPMNKKSFQEAKKEAEKEKGIKIVEVSPGVWKTRIQG